jgi:hypothetical protein
VAKEKNVVGADRYQSVTDSVAQAEQLEGLVLTRFQPSPKEKRFSNSMVRALSLA